MDWKDRTDWNGIVPPLKIENPPSTRDEVFLDLAATSKSMKRAWFRRAALHSKIWHEGWFLNEDYPEKTYFNMSRYLVIYHDEDADVKELREGIYIYDVVVNFPDQLRTWIMGWSISAAYKIAMAIHEIIGKHPLKMSEDEIAQVWDTKILTMIDVLNNGKVTVREVRSILIKAKMLEAKDSDPNDEGGEGKSGRRTAVEIALKVIQDSPDGFVGDLYVGRHQKKKRSTEMRIAELVDAFADQEDMNRDDAIVTLLEAGYKKLGRKDHKEAA